MLRKVVALLTFLPFSVGSWCRGSQEPDSNPTASRGCTDLNTSISLIHHFIYERKSLGSIECPARSLSNNSISARETLASFSSKIGNDVNTLLGLAHAMASTGGFFGCLGLATFAENESCLSQVVARQIR